MKLRELIQKIEECCLSNGLSYDGNCPQQVSPGVYMFYAVECSRRGSCRQFPRFVIQMGDKVKLA